MTDNCEPLLDVRAALMEKYEKAVEAIDELAANIARAIIALAAAEAVLLTCTLAAPAAPVAIACAVAAGIAIATAAATLHTYELELDNAERARGEAVDAIEILDGVLSHCRALASWQEEEAIELLQQAPDPNMIDIPEVDDSAIDDAESLLAQIEQPDFDDAYA